MSTICYSNAPGCLDDVHLLPVLDSSGGVTARLSRARKLTLRMPSLRCLDLVDCPLLEMLDLGDLSGELHISVRDCPNLRAIRLPGMDREGAAHLHLDAGPGPFPCMEVSGAIAQVDACWGTAKKVLCRIPARSLPWTGALLTSGGAPNSAQLAQPWLADGLLVWSPTEEDHHQECSGPDVGPKDVHIVDASQGLRSLEWAGRNPLRSLVVEDAPWLMAIRLRTRISHLIIERLDRFRVVTTEGALCEQISIRSCCSKLDVPLASGLVRQLPRLRPFLVVDAPCHALTISDTQCQRLCVFHPCSTRLELIRCDRLHSLRIDSRTCIRIEGSVPFKVLDRLDEDSVVRGIDEGSLRLAAAQIAAGGRNAWPRMERAIKWCTTARSISTALSVLAGLPSGAVKPRLLWRARERLYSSQPRKNAAWRWVWNLSPDLAAQAYRDDFRILTRCWQIAGAQELVASIATEVLRPHSETVVEAMLPWIFSNLKELDPPQLNTVCEILREASHIATVPERVEARLSRGLPHLLRLFEGLERPWALECDRVAEAAFAYFVHHGPLTDAVAWLGIELKADRVATQARLAGLLMTPARAARLTHERRAALSVLMLTGRPPPLTNPNPIEQPA